MHPILYALHMAHDDSIDQLEVLKELREIKAQGDKLAEQFASHRKDARENALRAVTHYGVSVARAAETVGVDRRTLTTWLQVHNAEQKALKK